jgi:1-acyl-sn-glycerol-3-phosphate acyltransferase
MLPVRTRAYFAYLRFLRRYHRFSMEGLERLLSPGAKLVVGYHGRGLPMDLAIVTLEIYERKGYLPRSITHRALYELPVARALFPYFGGVSGDGPEVARAFGSGEAVFVAPGGTREATRSFRERYVVRWGDRKGYLRLALKYRVPIVPVASSGVDDRFIGLNDGHAWNERLGLRAEPPPWLGIGAVGVFPLALPLPSRIHTIVGEPIDPSSALGEEPATKEHLDELHHRTTRAVQRLLDEALAKA